MDVVNKVTGVATEGTKSEYTKIQEQIDQIPRQVFCGSMNPIICE